MRRGCWLPFLTVAIALSSCAAPTTGAKPAATPHKFDSLSLSFPAQVAGYDAANEADNAKILGTGGADSLLDGGQVISFRKIKLLVATLEIGRLVPDVNANDRSFQQQIVDQVGSSILRATTIKGRTVWQGQGNRQLVYVWFEGRLMHVLLTHDINDPTPLVTALLDQP